MSWFAGFSYSHESDYRSYGLHGVSAAGHPTATRNGHSRRSFFDQVKMILPIELRTPATGGFPSAPNEYEYPWVKKYAGGYIFLVTDTERPPASDGHFGTYIPAWISWPAFPSYLFQGFLLGTEKLPSVRIKWPIAVRASWFCRGSPDHKAFLPFYLDDWGWQPIRPNWKPLSKRVNFCLFHLLPFYSQSGIRYFAGYLEHQHTEKYYSSNFDLSVQQSFFGGGLRYTPWKGVGH